MATPEHKNLCPGGQEIYNYGRPFLLTSLLYINDLSDLCLVVEIYNFGKPFLSHHNYILHFSEPFPMSREQDFF